MGGRRRAAGLSIVEMLVALAISGALMAATMVALDASFHAYATAAESASTQSSSRLVMQRMLAMVRGSTLHDAYDPADANVTLQVEALGAVQSVGIQMIDNSGQLLRVWWQVNAAYEDPNLGDLWYQIDANSAMPLLEQVRVQRDANDNPYVFSLTARDTEDGLLLARATVDLTVEPGSDATLSIENVRGVSSAVRLVGSTMPRRNLP